MTLLLVVLVPRLRGRRGGSPAPERPLSREEVHQVLTEARASGTIHPGAGGIASRALDFGRLTAAHVMVPRQRVVAIPRQASPKELQRILLEHGHTRMPVYEGEEDVVVGYVNVKDTLALAWERQLVVLEDLLRPALFVPEAKPAIDLLHEMRAKRMPLAIVVDEAGGMSGIVTVEDLLEELVGEILSERAEDPPPSTQRAPDGTALVPGEMPIRELNRDLGVALEEAGGFTTVGGLCMALAGRFPEKGEVLCAADGTTLTVVQASDRRVILVRVKPGESGAA